MKYLKEIMLLKKKEIKEIKKAGWAGNNKIKAEPGKESIKRKVSGKKGRFIKKIDKGKVNIIAEIKRASPSRGIINDKLDIEKTAGLYDRFRNFICGISILTESLYFKGNPEDIAAVKKKTKLPVLRKDFIFSEAQVYQSAEIGADCILLISSILGFKRLEKLYRLASDIGLDVLVEVHTIRELDRALYTGAELIGINNRNLKNMKVNGKVIYEFLNYRSSDLSDRILVCESGVKETGYIRDLFSKGVSTFLIGEYFMRGSNLEKTLKRMETELKKGNLI
ncbi:MAG: indole-3-glycerol-phosphate synthase [Actinomycetota bacterium]|nr:indole-3-glycerol-phosphate synthase [Actinomycetota bacterium]